MPASATAGPPDRRSAARRCQGVPDHVARGSLSQRHAKPRTLVPAERVEWREVVITESVTGFPVEPASAPGGQPPGAFTVRPPASVLPDQTLPTPVGGGVHDATGPYRPHDGKYLSPNTLPVIRMFVFGRSPSSGE